MERATEKLPDHDGLSKLIKQSRKTRRIPIDLTRHYKAVTGGMPTLRLYF
ncbi:MAG: hypothetical protein M1151_00980 [Candidatus Thermoplasmatota archaeon]|nr:hypothetical protein [Candidatus Thermoplasmatota archaeon]MCL5785227.1 hypothetical protein [Candidatus Thermoplasmatota archaeon]